VKVAVTGASGFIGHHVLAELSRKHVKVVAVTRNAKRLQNVASGISVVEMDISLSGADGFARMGSPDILIHLAWDGLPNYKSLHHFESELPNQYKFLKTLVEAGLPSLFVAGTCFEYGMQSGELSELVMPCPNNPYSYAKDALRKQLEFLKSSKSFNLTWGRLFYMYGEGQSGYSLYSQLKEAVLLGNKAFNMSGGEQLRDYLPVADVAKWIVWLALYCSDSGVVNICSGKPVSVRRVVEEWLIENSWEIEQNLGYYPYPDYEPMAFWGNSTKLNSIKGAISES
jgi:dTDP-6-deoxy-L-talose 4-dehydrogenase (NAD+)